MSAWLLIWVGIAIPLTVPWGIMTYRHGFSDGTIKPGNLRASILLAPLYALGWPVLLVILIFGAFFAFLDDGNP